MTIELIKVSQYCIQTYADRPEWCLPWGPSASWLMGNDKDARNISIEEVKAKVHSIGLAP